MAITVTEATHIQAVPAGECPEKETLIGNHSQLLLEEELGLELRF